MNNMSQEYYIKRVDTRGIRQDMYIKLWGYINIEFQFAKQNATVFEGDKPYVALTMFLSSFSENKDYFEYFKEPIPQKKYVIVKTEDGKYFKKHKYFTGFYNSLEDATIYDDKDVCSTDAIHLKNLLPDLDLSVRRSDECVDF